MFEPNPDKFTSKPEPKKEFIRYLKETGASAALQKAMILLYKMPVKPKNLAEYFSEYFENGAQRMMRISMLQAELCYKRDELENQLMKEEAMENRIKELIDQLGISESEFEERFMPEEIKLQNRLSMLERYFKEMESGVHKTHSDDGSHHIPDTGTGATPIATVTTEEGDMDFDYDEENKCLKNVKSQQAMLEDIKEIDPWGIICKAPKESHGEERGHSHGPKRRSGGSVPDEYDDDYDPDDDDATLAEVFHQAAHDSLDYDQDEVTAKLHSQLLMVREANKAKMADFLGWSPLQSRQDIRTIRGELPDSTLAQVEGEGEEEDLNLEEDKTGAVESFKRRPCEENMMEKTGGKSPGRVDLQDDAFLFDDDDEIELVYKMLEAEQAQEHFDYDFEAKPRDFPKERKPEECRAICKTHDTEAICKKLTGKDGTVDKSGTAADFIPGKMINWTHQYNEYPCPSTAEFSDEPVTGAYYMKGTKTKSRTCAPGAGDAEKPEIPLMRVDSSCHCFAGSYGTDEMMDDEDEERDSNKKRRNQDKKLSLEPPSDEELLDKNAKVDRGTITDETILDSELQEVFKQKAKKSIIRKSLAEGKIKTTDEEQQEVDASTHSDVFGVNLANEIRRTILGTTPSELQMAKDEMDAHHENLVAEEQAQTQKPKRRTKGSLKEQNAQLLQ